MNDNDTPSEPGNTDLPDPYGAPDLDPVDDTSVTNTGAAGAGDAADNDALVVDSDGTIETTATEAGVAATPSSPIQDTVADDAAAAFETAAPDEIDGLIDPSLTDDDFDKFVNDDRPGGFEDVLSRPASPLPPPPMAPPTGRRKLVRDPYSRLGGVCSGLAHYFGLDVTLVRFAVLVGSIITGIGFLVYFVAWAVIPRATVWPPVGQVPGDTESSISNRNMAVGLVLLGLLIFLGVTGGPGEIVVPLLLVGGGIALLRKAPASAPAPVPAGAPSAAAAASMGASTMPPPPGAPMGQWQSALPQPVPPRTKGRKALRALVVVPLVLLPLAGIAAVVGLVAMSDGAEFNFESGGVSFDEEFGGDNVVAPLNAASLQPSYERQAGSIELDLRSLDDSMFTEPFDVDVQLDIGEIAVLVPEDLSVSVQAQSNLGEITVFESHTEGINEELGASDDNPSVRLDLDVDVGEIAVVRAG